MNCSQKVWKTPVSGSLVKTVLSNFCSQGQELISVFKLESTSRVRLISLNGSLVFTAGSKKLILHITGSHFIITILIKYTELSDSGTNCSMTRFQLTFSVIKSFRHLATVWA